MQASPCVVKDGLGFSTLICTESPGELVEMQV